MLNLDSTNLNTGLFIPVHLEILNFIMYNAASVPFFGVQPMTQRRRLLLFLLMDRSLPLGLGIVSIRPSATTDALLPVRLGNTVLVSSWVYCSTQVFWSVKGVPQ